MQTSHFSPITPASKYILISSISADGLSIRVQDYLNGGWVLFGLPLMAEKGYAQALIKLG